MAFMREYQPYQRYSRYHEQFLQQGLAGHVEQLGEASPQSGAARGLQRQGNEAKEG
jgi:hypothetical protein